MLPSPALAQDYLYAPLKHRHDPARRGKGIERTMTLLATSTPQKRNTVRILFYGQSITEQTWSKSVAVDLKRRFPHANLIIENRALGGFASQMLVKTAETDLYSFYPDLLIFHVYGGHQEYEDIIRRTRERTTADVLIQTDHVTRDEDLTEETDPTKLWPDGKRWNSFMNYLHLPTVARKYGCGIVEQRDLWKQYLRDHNFPAAKLLSDNVHLNDYGCFLMAEIVKDYLVPRSDTRIAPMECDRVRTFIVGKDVHWKNGTLTLPFVGNRVDLVAKDGKPVPVSIAIDGVRPSQHPELYGFTRALATPGGKWPVIANLSSESPLLLEDWTLQVARDPEHPARFTFTLTGSKTGGDGEGSSDKRFVSRSGRVMIDPEDWNVDYALALPGIKPVPETFVVRWSVVPYFQDTFTPRTGVEPGVENTVTIAQGLSNGKHLLTLTGEASVPLAAIRVYRPPFGRETAEKTTTTPQR